jgi:hypothetical protein
VEPAFIDAAETGPPQKLVDEATAKAKLEYRRYRELVDSGKGLGLDPDSRAKARQVTETNYVQKSVSDYVLSYRSSAVAGLGLTAGPAAINTLQKLAADAESPLGRQARKILANRVR